MFFITGKCIANYSCVTCRVTHSNQVCCQLLAVLHVAGKCVVDQTEKGWFMQYVDRDPEAIRKQEAAQRKEKMDLDDEEKAARLDCYY